MQKWRSSFSYGSNKFSNGIFRLSGIWIFANLLDVEQVVPSRRWTNDENTAILLLSNRGISSVFTFDSSWTLTVEKDRDWKTSRLEQRKQSTKTYRYILTAGTVTFTQYFLRSYPISTVIQVLIQNRDIFPLRPSPTEDCAVATAHLPDKNTICHSHAKILALIFMARFETFITTL